MVPTHKAIYAKSYQNADTNDKSVSYLEFRSVIFTSPAHMPTDASRSKWSTKWLILGDKCVNISLSCIFKLFVSGLVRPKTSSFLALFTQDFPSRANYFKLIYY